MVFSSRYFSLLFLFTVFISPASVSENLDTIELLKLRAKQLKLSEQTTWSKLLYFDHGSSQSAVVNKNYFLHEQGNIDKEKELIASLDGYFLPWEENKDLHPLCKFPSRYYWLSKQLGLPDFEKNLTEHCHRLNVWGYHNRADSVSLMLVSGYLGNPASSFGHSFLKINLEGKQSNLFDKSLNYGASVPAGESIIRYVALGILGGYEGKFTDEYFFTQDRVYSRTEFRDMWEYELNLNEEQLRFLMLHIWDITGREFQYFFFDQNCAYRIGQLIDLVSDTQLSDDSRPWYLPETLFQNLDSQRADLVTDIRFIPSSQRLLYSQLNYLNKDEIKIIESIHKGKTDEHAAWEAIDQLEEDRRIIILDALLAYHKYLLIASGNQPDEFMLKLEQKILLKRLILPAKPREQTKLAQLSSPAQGNKASLFGIAAFDNKFNEGLRLNLAAYRKDLTTRNSLEGNELTLLNITIDVDKENSEVKDVDIVRASNLKPSVSYLSSEHKWAWQIHIGAQKDEISEKYSAFFKGSIGKSYYLLDSMFVYGLAGSTLDNLKPHANLNGRLGWVYLHPRFNTSAFYEQSQDDEGEESELSEFNANYFFTDNSNIFFKVSDQRFIEYSAGFNLFF